MKLLIILLSTVLLSGCLATINTKLNHSHYNSVKKYKEPVSGKTAQVRVFYFGGAVSIHPNSTTRKDIKNDIEGGRTLTKETFSGVPGFGKIEYEPKNLGMPFEPTTTKAFGEFKITTERPVIIEMSYSSNNGTTSKSCSYGFYRAQFEEHKNYAIRVTGCNYEILEYLDNGKLVPLKNIEKI